MSQEFQGYFEDHVFLQLGIIAATYLLATLLARKVGQHLEKNAEKVQLHVRMVLSPAHFAIVVKYIIWLVLIWFFHALFKRLELSFEVLNLGIILANALLVIRFVSFYIKSIFWTRLVYVICMVVVFLRMFKLWEPTVRLLDSMTISLGSISFSLWEFIEVITVFVLMWGGRWHG